MDDEKRKERNRDLIERMRRGEKLSYQDASETWLPKRPLVEKDTEAMSRLYKTDMAFEKWWTKLLRHQRIEGRTDVIIVSKKEQYRPYFEKGDSPQYCYEIESGSI